ncbi:MAG: hypothetical protein WBD13_17485 [Burkholderiaceae bacterium]
MPRLAKVKAAAEAAVEEDCAPPAEIKVKPKPSVFSRKVLGEPEQPKTFAEQIKKQRTPIKPRKSLPVC